MGTKELEKTVRRLRELEARATRLSEEIDALKDAIKAELEARGAEELQVDVFRVRWTVVRSSRFDNAAFKREMPELYNRFTRQTETRRFTVA